MTAVDSSSASLTQQQLVQLLQYTVEAYKTFQKLAENLPNPMAATMFKQFAVDEREARDLISLKIESLSGTGSVKVTLGGDLLFQDILEGDLSYREMAEFLISRERAMEKKLRELSAGASDLDRGLLIYLASGKRAHNVELERELELIRIDPDWFKREDAEWRIVHGLRAK